MKKNLCSLSLLFFLCNIYFFIMLYRKIFVEFFLFGYEVFVVIFIIVSILIFRWEGNVEIREWLVVLSLVGY